MPQLQRFTRHITVLFIILLLSPNLLQAGTFEKGLLWSVNKPGQSSSYVFGTMHSEHPSVVNIPQAVQRAFDQSKSFTAEMKMDMSSIMQSQMRMMLPPNKSLINLLGQQKFRRSAYLMQQYGIPEQFVEKMKPWAVAVTLQLPKPQGGLALDLALYQQAASSGKVLYGLETVDEQINLFDNLPTAQQITMLEQSLKDYSDMPSKINAMMQLYLQRDIGGLLRFSRREMARIDPVIADHMDRNMLVKRNHRMVKRMKKQLSEGNAFIAIGALHLPGKEGVLQLLENNGYRVQAVY